MLWAHMDISLTDYVALFCKLPEIDSLKYKYIILLVL